MKCGTEHLQYITGWPGRLSDVTSEPRPEKGKEKVISHRRNSLSKDPEAGAVKLRSSSVCRRAKEKKKQVRKSSR